MIVPLNRVTHKAEQLKLNLSYSDKSLEKLKQQHNELTLMNLLLSQKMQEFLKEDRLLAVETDQEELF